MKGFIDDLISSFKTDPRISKQKLLARQNRWRFTSRKRFERDVIALHDFQLFQGKGDKRLKAIIQTTSEKVGGSFRIYDYVYYGELGTKITTVFEYSQHNLALPSLVIRPKGKFNYFKEFFVTPEMFFPTTPSFNKNYEIRTDDKIAIRKSLNVEFLDEIGDVGGWVFEGEANSLLSYQFEKQIPTSAIQKDFNRFAFLCERLVHGKNAM